MLDDLLSPNTFGGGEIAPKEKCSEILLKFCTESQVLRDAIVSLMGAHESLQGKVYAHRGDVLDVLADYLITLIRTPDVFFPDAAADAARPIVAHCIVRKKGLSFLRAILQSRPEHAEAIIPSVIYYAAHVGVAPDNLMQGTEQRLGTLELLLSLPGVSAMLKNPAYWGLAPMGVDEARERGLARMAHINQRQECRTFPGLPELSHAATGSHTTYLKCFIDGFLESFLRIGPRDCPDLLRENRIEKYKKVLEFEQTAETLHNQMHTALHNLIKKEKSSEDTALAENFCRFLFMAFRLNQDRMKAQYDEELVATDGYVHNLSRILMCFCVPFADRPEKLSLVSSSFLENNAYVDFSQFDPVGCKMEYCADAKQEYNFINKFFYAKILVNLLSIVNLADSLIENRKYLRNLKNNLRYLNSQGSGEDGLGQLRVQKVELLIRETTSLIEAKTAIANSSFVVEQEMKFIFMEIEFIYRLIREERLSSYPAAAVDGLLAKTKMLMGTSKFNSSYCSYEKFGDAQKRMIIFCSKLIRNPSLNVHTKEKALEIVYSFTSMKIPYLEGFMGSLIEFYNTVQKSVRSPNQRLTLRNLVDLILTKALETRAYSDIFRSVGPEEPYRAFFIHLVSLLGDTIEQSLDEIRKIKHAEETLSKLKAEGKSEGEEAAEVHYGMMSSREMASMFFSVVWDTIKLISILFDLNMGIFLDEVILTRFVSMLNGTLMSLTGKKCSGLVIQDMEQVNFRPKELLARIVTFYIGMRDDRFLTCILGDEGVFKIEMLEKSLQICRKKGTLTNAEISRLTMFINKLRNLPSVKDTSGEFDIPEEFLDPLTYAPMKEPVILTTSNTRVDRSTAEMILLNDPIDPFTRTPITEENVVPDKDLQERISEYYRAKEHSAPLPST